MPGRLNVAWLSLIRNCKLGVVREMLFKSFTLNEKRVLPPPPPHLLVAQMIMNPSTVQETQVQSLGLEDLLEKGRAAHSSVPAWRIPWTEERGGL